MCERGKETEGRKREEKIESFPLFCAILFFLEQAMNASFHSLYTAIQLPQFYVVVSNY